MRATSKHRASPLLVTLALVVLAGVSGCKSVTPANDGGSGSGLSSFCNLDSECNKGFRCDRELHRCVCTSDSSCPSSLYCDAFTGACVATVPGCTSDGDCQDPTTEYCNVQDHTCYTRKHFCEACTSDVQCGTSNDKCVTDPTLNQKFCGKACASNADCPTNASCQTVSGVKTCWPTAATCNQLLGCNPDSGQTCTQDTDCTQGTDQICDTVAGHCVARVSTCPYGMVCDLGTHQCAAACTTDTDCASDPKCQNGPCHCTNNQCVPIAVCKTNADCTSPKVCILAPGSTTGECGTGCTTDGDCPVGQVCNVIAGVGSCSQGCTTHADCPLSANCIAGHCEETNSTGTVNYCQAANACPLCQICSADSGGQTDSCKPAGQPYCDSCTQAGSTPNSCAKVSATEYCCNVSIGNGQYQEILGQDCASGQPCPRGFYCQPIQTASGNVLAHDCFPWGNTCAASTCN